MLILASCVNKNPDKVTDANDYEKYLHQTENKTFELAQEELTYWKTKFDNAPNQVSYLGKIAGAHSTLFEQTGEINHLKAAESSLSLAIEKTNSNSVGYLHALARNYISQHRFKEALKLLETADGVGEKKHITDNMFFDVHLELGNVEQAKNYLNKIRKTGYFDYLIRLSKWEDHQGNLDGAILQMEKAMAKTEEAGYENLMLWSYTNLADYYGHAGRITDSYNYYLKALEINPNYTDALKGIAWIAFSNDKNVAESRRIIEAIQEVHPTPDLHLFLADLAEHEGDSEAKKAELTKYFAMLNDNATAYGDMYNSYNIQLLADDESQVEEAIRLASIEVANRPTPQAYDLLAWAHYKNGEELIALNIMQQHVENHTSEPVAMYHLAEIYNAAGMPERAKEIKPELVASIYELGPNMVNDIEKL